MAAKGAEAHLVSGVSVQRWKRYGHDRLYAQTASGQRLGHCDLTTGTVVLEPGADRLAVEAAVTSHPAYAAAATARLSTVALADHMPTAVPSSRRPADDQLPATASGAAVRPPQPESLTTLPWVDLASNRPGAAPRVHAVALRQEAPVRTFVERLFGVRTEERRWRIGADGEEVVAAELAGLDNRWRVLHSVPVGKGSSDIDHVVIGPPGVFTVNTKHHPTAAVWVRGTGFTVNGRPVHYVRHSQHEARRATKLLAAAAGVHPGPAVGVIAVVGASRGLTIHAQPEGVHVTARRDLRGWLERQAARLTDTQVHALYEAARRSSTWSSTPR